MDLADIEIKTGPSMIYREHHRRFVAVKFAVRGVDLATAVTDARRRLVFYFNQLRKDGLPLHDAIMKGAKLRLRPNVMASLTAELGLLPAALPT